MTRTALVEQDDTVMLGIKETAMRGLATRAGAAMEKKHGYTPESATLLQPKMVLMVDMKKMLF